MDDIDPNIKELVESREFLEKCLRNAGLDEDTNQDTCDACEMYELTALSLGYGLENAADKLFLTQEEADAVLGMCRRQCLRAGVRFTPNDVYEYSPEDEWKEVGQTTAAAAPMPSSAPAAQEASQPLQSRDSHASTASSYIDRQHSSDSLDGLDIKMSPLPSLNHDDQGLHGQDSVDSDDVNTQEAEAMSQEGLDGTRANTQAGTRNTLGSRLGSKLAEQAAGSGVDASREGTLASTLAAKAQAKRAELGLLEVPGDSEPKPTKGPLIAAAGEGGIGSKVRVKLPPKTPVSTPRAPPTGGPMSAQAYAAMMSQAAKSARASPRTSSTGKSYSSNGAQPPTSARRPPVQRSSFGASSTGTAAAAATAVRAAASHSLPVSAAPSSPGIAPSSRLGGAQAPQVTPPGKRAAVSRTSSLQTSRQSSASQMSEQVSSPVSRQATSSILESVLQQQQTRAQAHDMNINTLQASSQRSDSGSLGSPMSIASKLQNPECQGSSAPGIPSPPGSDLQAHEQSAASTIAAVEQEQAFVHKQQEEEEQHQQQDVESGSEETLAYEQQEALEDVAEPSASVEAPQTPDIQQPPAPEPTSTPMHDSIEGASHLSPHADSSTSLNVTPQKQSRIPTPSDGGGQYPYGMPGTSCSDAKSASGIPSPQITVPRPISSNFMFFEEDALKEEDSSATGNSSRRTTANRRTVSQSGAVTSSSAETSTVGPPLADVPPAPQTARASSSQWSARTISIPPKQIPVTAPLSTRPRSRIPTSSDGGVPGSGPSSGGSSTYNTHSHTPFAIPESNSITSPISPGYTASSNSGNTAGSSYVALLNTSAAQRRLASAAKTSVQPAGRPPMGPGMRLNSMDGRVISAPTVSGRVPGTHSHEQAVVGSHLPLSARTRPLFSSRNPSPISARHLVNPSGVRHTSLMLPQKVFERPILRRTTTFDANISPSLLKPTKAFLAWCGKDQDSKDSVPEMNRQFKARPLPKYLLNRFAQSVDLGTLGQERARAAYPDRYMNGGMNNASILDGVDAMSTPGARNGQGASPASSGSSTETRPTVNSFMVACEDEEHHL